MENSKKARKINGWKYATVILAGILVLVMTLALTIMVRWRTEAHMALRQARNIWMALRMTGIEYYGMGDNMYDSRRLSGLKKEAEQQVRELTEFEGSVSVLKSEGDIQVPTEMIYQEGPYMVYYYQGEDSSRNWLVYRTHDLFDLSTAVQSDGA